MPARGLCALAAIAVVAAETSQVEQLMREVAELKQQMASLTALLEVAPDADDGAEQQRRPGRRLTSSSASRASITYDGAEVLIDANARINGNLTVTGHRSSLGTCYTRWGVWGCPSDGAFTAVIKGYGGAIEAHSTSGFGEYQTVNDDCIDTDAAASGGGSWSSDYYQRLTRVPSADDGTGAVFVDGKCTTCCSGGCYVRYGGTDCARGYSAVYTGRAGGIENYQQSFGARGQTKTMCVDTTASVQTDYSSQTDVLMRLFRYTNDGVGMDAVSASCAMCCVV